MDSLLSNFQFTGVKQRTGSNVRGDEFKYDLGASVFEDVEVLHNAIEIMIERVVLTDNHDTATEKIVILEFSDFEEIVVKNSLEHDLNLQKTYPFEFLEELRDSEFMLSILNDSDDEKKLSCTIPIDKLVKRKN